MRLNFSFKFTSNLSFPKFFKHVIKNLWWVHQILEES